jgi:hypothetical protein
MARVVLGPVGAELTIPSDLCVKSGIRTDDRVILRGSTTPGWVNVLLLFTIVGWIFASGMASRRFRVVTPFVHQRHEQYRRGFLSSAVMATFGLGGVIWSVSTGSDHAGAFLLLVLGGIVLGAINSWITMVGFHQDADGLLVMTRVHPVAAAAIREATSGA